VISETVLVLAGAFGERLDAERVAEAIGRGLRADGRLECDLCPIDEDADRSTAGTAREAGGPAKPVVGQRAGEASALLDGLDFNRRMRAARAVVIARESLDGRTLAGSVAFEAATRARQAGVPAYAVARRDALDPFEARIVDLQVILQASTPRALAAAGRKLAALV
jgi:glycerate kinase